MKFNIDDYKGKYVMHCKTEEEVRSFCDYLRRARNRKGYSVYSHIDRFKSKTAYNFNNGMVGDVDFYSSSGYTVLEWSNFMNDTKGNERIDKVFDILGVEPFEEFFIADEEYSGVKYYIDYDLKIYAMPSDSDFGMEEERSDIIILDILKNKLKIQRIYKPTEKEQLAIDYALACGYSWIAKDKDGTIYAYKEKPQKIDNNHIWAADNSFRNGTLKIGLPISFLSWDDEEPYYIGY